MMEIGSSFLEKQISKSSSVPEKTRPLCKLWYVVHSIISKPSYMCIMCQEKIQLHHGFNFNGCSRQLYTSQFYLLPSNPTPPPPSCIQFSFLSFTHGISVWSISKAYMFVCHEVKVILWLFFKTSLICVITLFFLAFGKSLGENWKVITVFD